MSYVQILLATDSSAIDTAIECLRSGGVVAHATETCYGLVCDLTNHDAVEKLFQIKDRPTDQPVSALFSDLKTAEEWLLLSGLALEIAKKHLPGPLTIILPVRPTSSPFFITADRMPAKEAGLRISPHPIAYEIAKRFGRPVATTSANVHGEANPYSVSEMTKQFDGREHQPDLLLDSGTLLSSPPSTVIRMIGASVETMRKGDVQIS